jgi:hypothetical protein
MNENLHEELRRSQEKKQRSERLFQEELAKIPLEQRNEDFVLGLIRNNDIDPLDVSKAITSDEFPQTALTFDVAVALPFHGRLGKEIPQFLPDDHQRIIEWYIKNCDDTAILYDFISDVLGSLTGSAKLDRRALTEALLHSNISASAILENAKHLELTSEEISTLIDTALNGGYIEGVIRVLDKIPNLDEKVFIEKLLAHKEKEGNAIKIIKGFQKFHVSKEWFEEKLRKYDLADYVEILMKKVMDAKKQ